MRAKHLLVKSTERAGPLKGAKKSARAENAEAAELTLMTNVLKMPERDTNTTFTQPAAKAVAPKQKSKSFKASFVKTAAGLLKLNASSEPHEEPIRMPNQPVTTSHQSMMQKNNK